MANAFFRAAAIPALVILILTGIFVILSYTVTSPAQTPPTPSPTLPEVVDGLSYTFHEATCPQLESIIRIQLQAEFEADIGQAAGLLRLHFHDCFVQGCDSSVLLDGSASGPSEQDAPPNLSLRRRAFTIIENLRRMIHDVCNQTVSCSDITALAARDAVFLVKHQP